MHDEADAPQESGVKRLFHVGGQHREPAILLHTLQKIGDLDVGVAIVAVLDFGALAEERVGLIEEEKRSAVFSRIEDTAQALFGLADVLADDLAEVDAVEIELQFIRKYLGSRCFSCAAYARKQCRDAQTAQTRFGESPAVVDMPAVAHLGGNRTQSLHLGLGQNQPIPAGGGL